MSALGDLSILDRVPRDPCQQCYGQGVRPCGCDSVGHYCLCGHVHKCGTCQGARTISCHACQGTGDLAALEFVRERRAWRALPDPVRAEVLRINPFCWAGYPRVAFSGEFHGRIEIAADLDSLGGAGLERVGFRPGPVAHYPEREREGWVYCFSCVPLCSDESREVRAWLRRLALEAA